MASTLSKGTALKIKVGSATSYVKVAGLKDFSGIGSGTATVMDVSDLDSAAKEKRMGLADEGQVKFTFNYLPADAGQQGLEDARSGATLSHFEVIIPDGNINFTFDGYVLSTEKSGGVDKTMELSATVEITGAVTKATGAGA